MKKGILFLALAFLLVGCIPEEPGFQADEEAVPVTVGYIGCSNTRETVEGYYYTGGRKMWPYERRYGSGTILDWSRNLDEGSKYWDVFDELLKKYPKTKMIWWELCIMDEDRATSYEYASIILNQIRERIPGAVIYVSPLPPYTEGVCEITGTFGLEKAKELAKELDEKNEDVFTGPVLGPMNPTDTAADGCHLSSPDGKRKLGRQMRLFFDAEEYPADEASVGYIGCSNTMQSIAAYWSVDSSEDRVLWKFDEQELHEYDGGAVVDWSKGAVKGNKFWNTFDRYFENNPNTKVIFWQLCIRKEESTPYEEALPVLEAIRKKVPEATIYVSPLPPYTEGACEITGTFGIERAKALAEELDNNNEDVLPGPVLGPMTPQDTDQDGCHLSEEGMQKLGQQMRSFFDGDPTDQPGVLSTENNLTIDDSAIKESSPLQEKTLIPEKIPLPFEGTFWMQRIEDAFAPSPCPQIKKPDYPDTYYQGPMIDTHLHLPAIPDWSPEDEEGIENKEISEGAFGGPQPFLGRNVKMSEIACTLKNEGTMKNFAFFPVYPEIPEQLLEVARRTMQQYPGLFTPFIMPPTEDTPTVEAKVLQKMLAVYPNLFQGYGEVGSSPTEEKNPPPDDPLYLENYQVAREHHLMVYYHPSENQADRWERVLQKHPDLTFIVHADEIEPDIDNLMNKYHNIYFTANPQFHQHFRLYVGKSKEEFLKAAERDFNGLITKDLQRWETLINKHPDRFMWGTDRGDAVWNYDQDVGLFLVKYGRAFIGRLDPAVQEKIGYKNAERLIEKNK